MCFGGETICIHKQSVDTDNKKNQLQHKPIILQHELKCHDRTSVEAEDYCWVKGQQIWPLFHWDICSAWGRRTRPDIHFQSHTNRVWRSNMCHLQYLDVAKHQAITWWTSNNVQDITSLQDRVEAARHDQSSVLPRHYSVQLLRNNAEQ